ncbi:hypothetical protein [Kineosporia babensis]|uniref:Transmembrane protein n=1 Tax=Kineosporia babensis TaxID=499548 RepID=A0A9X1N8W9_9ACTN|nr:hypothetical protein [Kineosporia babensis]MCD5309728.1 hypothetical protein [Kineosporia babensis]
MLRSGIVTLGGWLAAVLGAVALGALYLAALGPELDMTENTARLARFLPDTVMIGAAATVFAYGAHQRRPVHYLVTVLGVPVAVEGSAAYFSSSAGGLTLTEYLAEAPEHLAFKALIWAVVAGLGWFVIGRIRTWPSPGPDQRP